MPNWSWSSALAGAVAGVALSSSATAVVFARPKDPTFHLVSIALSSFHLNIPLVDVEFTLTIHVTNPNIVPITYGPAIVTIFYSGSILGTAEVHAGSQPAKSCQLLHLPARINGIELAHNVVSLLRDATHREMTLDAEVDINGDVRVLFWSHRFKLHVSSHILVDPVYLDVVDQENQAETRIFT